MAQVADTRQQGYAVDAGNYISGVTVVAAPVWKARGRPSHALVAIGIGSALRRGGVDELGATLLTSARTLSEQMGAEMPR